MITSCTKGWNLSWTQVSPCWKSCAFQQKYKHNGWTTARRHITQVTLAIACLGFAQTCGESWWVAWQCNDDIFIILSDCDDTVVLDIKWQFFALFSILFTIYSVDFLNQFLTGTQCLQVWVQRLGRREELPHPVFWNCLPGQAATLDKDILGWYFDEILFLIWLNITVFLVESDHHLQHISCYSSMLYGVGLWKQQVKIIPDYFQQLRSDLIIIIAMLWNFWMAQVVEIDLSTRKLKVNKTLDGEPGFLVERLQKLGLKVNRRKQWQK